ncbi:reverse transcriptase family protein [Weeksellaceae bacterium KMM 9713]|uniref:RNA-directed DNA polymerase n=1 Tax=Profundicola chukchiensis TaxID=2961959 RepID=A0A9X4MYA3_9FLAO|nr:reverse transcriptase family protein [Profundicola chukchiensis]MDG4945757.1 reverse transcriptase family protein [Profundicola chukchiensis]
METQLSPSQEIKRRFSAMKTSKDFSLLLSYAQNIYFGKENTKSISEKKLYYFANPEYNEFRYQQFSIAKKSGGERIINAPHKDLKTILKVLNFVLQQVLQPHHAATGFVPGKSIVDNAKLHVGKNYVYNIDLKDFFHSFDKKRVKSGLIYSLKRVNISIEEPIAYLIACLCTHPLEIDGTIKTVLPQGSPTSPTLTNILCQRLDRRLSGLAKRFNATYSRYADDISFSSDHNIYQEEFLDELNRIISVDNKFELKLDEIKLGPELKLNNKKTRLQHKHGYRQEVTGLIVNDKVNVHRSYVKTIRTWLYQWERYGYKKAQANFKKDYMSDKGHIKSNNAELVNVLSGKLQFLKMVKGEHDPTFAKLNQRFEKLPKPNNKIDKILDIWEKEGIDAAIELQKKQTLLSNNLVDISVLLGENWDLDN